MSSWVVMKGLTKGQVETNGQGIGNESQIKVQAKLGSTVHSLNKLSGGIIQPMVGCSSAQRNKGLVGIFKPKVWSWLGLESWSGIS